MEFCVKKVAYIPNIVKKVCISDNILPHYCLCTQIALRQPRPQGRLGCPRLWRITKNSLHNEGINK